MDIWKIPDLFLYILPLLQQPLLSTCLNEIKTLCCKYAGKKLWTIPASKKILDSASKLGIKKIESHFSPSVTHVVIGSDVEPDPFLYLAALVTGISVVKISWLLSED